MSSRSLPPRPSLAQLKLQAKELHRLHRERSMSAAARIVAHHPRFRQRYPRAGLAEHLSLADAQLVIAREYGFESWAKLKNRVETSARITQFKPHPRFDDAVSAIVAGDVERLRALITSAPELVRSRTNLDPSHGYFAGAMLLHHVAWNPSRDEPAHRMSSRLPGCCWITART